MPFTTVNVTSGSGRGNIEISVATSKKSQAVQKGSDEGKNGTQSEGASERVMGVEKSYALDTAALLGGNEYLVSQMLDNLSQAVYSGVERAAIKWALRELCQGWTGDEVPEMAATGFNQGHLVNYFTKTNRERLPKTIAMGLLYCGRYEDTTILQSTANKQLRAIVINMDNYPMVKKPVGQYPAKSGPPVPCRRLALLYFKSDKDEDLINMEALAASPASAAPNAASVPPPAVMARRNISESLAMEKKMLSFVNVFAILPIP